MRSITDHFSRLGAPRRMVQQSWGAVRAADGVVFLIVWQDEVRKIDGSSWVQVANHVRYLADDPSNAGYRERLEHLALIDGGARHYLIMAVPKDTRAIPRSVKDFIDDAVFASGAARSVDGNAFMPVGARLPLGSVLPPVR